MDKIPCFLYLYMTTFVYRAAIPAKVWFSFRSAIFRYTALILLSF